MIKVLKNTTTKLGEGTLDKSAFDGLDDDVSNIITNLKKFRVISGVQERGNTNWRTYPKEAWVVIMSRHDTGSQSLWLIFNVNDTVGKVTPINTSAGGTLTYNSNGVMTLNYNAAYSYHFIRVV